VGGRKSTNSRFFSFALSAFTFFFGAFFFFPPFAHFFFLHAFMLFFLLRAFALFFWLRARERESAKKAKAPTSGNRPVLILLLTVFTLVTPVDIFTATPLTSWRTKTSSLLRCRPTLVAWAASSDRHNGWISHQAGSSRLRASPGSMASTGNKGGMIIWWQLFPRRLSALSWTLWRILRTVTPSQPSRLGCWESHHLNDYQQVALQDGAVG
jgi:hypothetical protein